MGLLVVALGYSSSSYLDTRNTEEHHLEHPTKPSLTKTKNQNFTIQGAFHSDYKIKQAERV